MTVSVNSQETDVIAKRQQDRQDNESGQGRCAVEHAIRQQLLASSYSSVRSVTCRYHDGQLTLQGCVPNYFSLQAAIHIALTTLRQMKLSPVRLHNQIVVAESNGTESQVAGNHSAVTDAPLAATATRGAALPSSAAPILPR